MSSIYSRIEQIRLSKGLNQCEFAALLDMSQSHLSRVERGLVPLTQKNITLISLKCGINESWLKTGVGEMFKSNLPPPGQDLIDVFCRLTPAGKKMVLEHARLALEHEQALQGEKDSPPPPQGAPSCLQHTP